MAQEADKAGSGSVIADGSTTSPPLSAWFSEFANIRGFGAKGDGVNNDAPAYNAAQAAGKAVLIPAGSYNFATLARPSSVPFFLVGPVTTVTSGFPWGSDGSAWNGTSGFGFGQTLDKLTNQSIVTIQGEITESPGKEASFETAALKVQMLHYAESNPGKYSKDGVAVLASMAAGSGNKRASICTINGYLIFPPGTNGSGSVAEYDVDNNTGVDNTIDGPFGHTGLLIVNQGPYKAVSALEITESGGAPFLCGISVYAGSVSKYAFVINKTNPTMYIDGIGNIGAPTVTLAPGGNSEINSNYLYLFAPNAGTRNVVLGVNGVNTLLFPNGVPIGSLILGAPEDHIQFAGAVTLRGAFADGSVIEQNFMSGTIFHIPNRAMTVKSLAAVSSLTFVLPCAPNEGQYLMIYSLAGIRSLTLISNVNINWNPDTLAPGKALLLQYSRGSWDHYVPV